VPVGHGQLRRGWVVVACLGYSRAGAGALIFHKEAPDVLSGMSRCLWSLGALPKRLVWDGEGCLHAGGGRPSESYAAFCGQLAADWYFCEPHDPQAKGAVERLQGYRQRGRAAGNVPDGRASRKWRRRPPGSRHRSLGRSHRRADGPDRFAARYRAGW
jgi:transposase